MKCRNFLFLLLLSLIPTSPASEVKTIAGTGHPGRDPDGAPALTARINNPFGITLGPDKSLYICEVSNHRISKISREGRLITVAGTGKAGYSGDGGPALAAELNEPYEIRFNRSGDLFFVEMRNHLIRRVEARTGNISTTGGTGRSGFSGDNGPARGAEFNQPHSIQFGPDQALYICDIGNHRIRQLDFQTGRISTFAGNGRKDRTPDGASIENIPLHGPRAIDFDAEGNMWLALREGNAIHKIDLKRRTIHHIAGTGEKGFTGNGGPAHLATLSGPKGIAVAPNGWIYFADTESHTVRAIDPRTAALHLILGTGTRGNGPDGDPLHCRLARPHGVYVALNGELYVGDSDNHCVRLLTPEAKP